MSRSRIVFVVIIGITLLVIAGIVLVQVIGNATDGNEVTDGDTAVSTPLPEGSVLVTVSSSNTKEAWMDQVVANFNASAATTDSGKRIVVEVSHVTSGGSLTAILDGKSQPTAWSPGDQSWIDQANQTWQQRYNKPIASAACAPTVYAPLGFAMWQPMAELLGWPNQPIGWDDIVALAEDPNGWASYGRPEWGLFRFGHTHPAYANSGLLSMTSFVYGIAGKTDNLTPADVYADNVQEAMRTLQQNTAKYGRQAPALLDLMARQGTNFLHAAAVPEAEVVRFNVERGNELTFPLVFIFPAEGTIWADQPYCVLDNADWVTDEQAEAAAIFRDYLLARPQQELAIDFYLRPLDTSIALHDPMIIENGTDPRISPATVPPLPSPDADLSAAIIDVFTINKRKATILVVIDISGSMEGEKIRAARDATSEFLGRLDADDEVGVMIFSDEVTLLSAPERVGDVVEGLRQRVSSLPAGGNTALYASVCEAVNTMADLQIADQAAGQSRLYGIILLSDGEDTVGGVTENQMFATCLPANPEADGIKIFPIAFGADADTDVLTRIAAVSGGRMFTADPTSIGDVYISISAEQ